MSMLNTKTLKTLAMEATTLGILAKGREKADVPTVIGWGPITIDAIEKIDVDGGFWSAICKEYPSYYFSLGTVFDKICDNWLDAYNGDVEMINHDLKESGEVVIKVTRDKTRRGQSFNNITIM